MCTLCLDTVRHFFVPAARYCTVYFHPCLAGPHRPSEKRCVAVAATEFQVVPLLSTCRLTVGAEILAVFVAEGSFSDQVATGLPSTVRR